MCKVIYIFFSISLFLSSCVGSRRLNYIQSEQFNTENITKIETQEQSRYKLQPYDIIAIQVKDAAGRISDQFALQQGGGGFIVPNEFSTFLANYPIDIAGNVNFPTIGIINVKDMTILEAQAHVTQLASEYYKDPIVLIRLVSFRVSVLGQVRNPGRYLIGNERMNILEVLALAGDLTDRGDRKVQLIRLNGNTEEVILLDLTNPNLFKSPYYYLRPNDKIIVNVLRARLQRDNLGLLGVLFGGISTLVLILNFINNNR
jgi:polysaccharide export outer membrane protein